MTRSLSIEGRLDASDGLSIKGLILRPGVFAPHVNGKPARVRFTRDVVLAAFARLRDRVREGRVTMRLVHPDLNPLSLPYGHVREVRADPTTGEVFITASEALPEVERLFDADARRALMSLGLSVRSAVDLRAATDTERGEFDYDALRLDVEAADVVDRGAFTGSRIVSHLPAGLVARIAAQHGTLPVTADAPGGSGAHATSDQGTQETRNTMPLLQGPQDIPEDVRQQLGTPELQAAYVEAYNRLVTQGVDPVAASQQAVAEALQHAPPAGGPPQPPSPPNAGSTPPVGMSARRTQDESTMTTDPKIQAQLQARAAELEDEVKTLQAQLSAKDGEKATLEARLGDVEGKLSAMEAEKMDRLARDDVATAVAAGKVPPAAETAYLSARKALGPTAWRDLMSAAPVVVPAGERGRVNASAATATPEEEDALDRAARLVQRVGVDGVFQAGLQDRPHVRAALAARHADDPRVQRLTATATKGGGN